MIEQVLNQLLEAEITQHLGAGVGDAAGSAQR